jgi:hypothetical protein
MTESIHPIQIQFRIGQAYTSCFARNLATARCLVKLTVMSVRIALYAVVGLYRLKTEFYRILECPVYAGLVDSIIAFKDPIFTKPYTSLYSLYTHIRPLFFLFVPQ